MPAPAPSSSLLTAALRYAALGWQVFPLHTMAGGKCTCGADVCSYAKHPRTPDGFKSATTDAERIRGWWRTWPDANIGIATGARSGLFVLDVDPDKGGDTTLGLLISENGALPHTVEALTGSGGRHYLFAHPGRHTPNSTSKLGPGLDVRGDGGYIVAAPSLHKSGARYEWQPECEPGHELAAAPAWIFNLMAPPAPQPKARPVVRDRPLRERKYADGALRAACETIERAPEGERNDTLNRAAFGIGQLVGGGIIARTTAEIVLLEAAVRAGLGSREISATMRSGLNAGEREPRGVPQNEADSLQQLSQEADPHAADGLRDPGGLSGAVGVERGDRPPDLEAVLDGNEDPRRGDPGSSGEGGRPAVALTDEGVGDFFATAADKIQWAFEPYIPKAGFVVVQGGPKSGKTWFAAWLAGECARMGLRVAVVEEEGAREVLRDRLKPFVPDPAALNGTLRILYRKRIRLDNVSTLKKLCDLYRGFDVIVLDPFIRLHGKKEQASDEMAIVLEAIQTLMSETGAAVVLVHHTKKNESWSRSSNADAGLDDGRGSGVTAGEADNVIAIKGVAPKQRVIGQVRFTVENPGSRVGAEFEKRTAVVDLAEGSTEPFTWMSPDDHQRPDEGRPQVDSVDLIVERIIDSSKIPNTEKAAVSASEIRRLLKCNKTAALEACRRLTRHGVLTCVEGRCGPLYFKPEVPE